MKNNTDIIWQWIHFHSNDSYYAINNLGEVKSQGFFDDHEIYSGRTTDEFETLSSLKRRK